LQPANIEERGTETSVTNYRIERDICHAASVTISKLIVRPRPKPKTQTERMRRVYPEDVCKLQNLWLCRCRFFHLDPVPGHFVESPIPSVRVTDATFPPQIPAASFIFLPIDKHHFFLNPMSTPNVVLIVALLRQFPPRSICPTLAD
jgi:hypothetical protein